MANNDEASNLPEVKPFLDLNRHKVESMATSAWTSSASSTNFTSWPSMVVTPSLSAHAGWSSSPALMFNDVLHQSNTLTPVQQSSLDFGGDSRSSPPRQASTLMELQPVTPSRVMNSPIGIISRGGRGETSSAQASSAMDLRTQFTTLETPASKNNDSPHRTLSSELKQPESANVDVSRQFKIIIGRQKVDKRGDLVTMQLPDTDNGINVGASTSSAGSGVVTMQLPAPDTGNSADIRLAAPLHQNNNESSDEEDSQNVHEIQKALNIKVDLMKENKMRRRRGGTSKLPKEIRGLMGEANLCCARGDHDDASKMCMEVIRLAPYAAEPFETLAMIYDEKGEVERSLQYSLLAAHLAPTDAEQWLHLAAACINQGDNIKALNCYSKAHKSKPNDHTILWDAAKLNIKMGFFNKAMVQYQSVVALIPTAESEKAISLARDMAKLCHKNGDGSLAIGLLQQALKFHGHRFTDEDCNMLCELLLLSKQYTAVLQVMQKHGSIVLSFTSEDPTLSSFETSKLVHIDTSASLPVDLQCKVVIAAIRLGKLDLVETVLERVLQLNPCDIGDLQFDIAESFMEIQEHDRAMEILDMLVASDEYSLAAVWLKRAECCRASDRDDEALESLHKCVTLAPGHVDAHIMYAQSCVKVDKFRQAIKTLDDAEGYESKPDDRMRLHMERYTLLKQWGLTSEQKRTKLSKAMDVALLMFANRLKNAFRDAKISLVRRVRHSSNPLAGELKLIQSRRNDFPELLDSSDQFLDGNSALFSKTDWWILFLETIEHLQTCSRYNDAITLTEGALLYAPWCEHSPDTRIALEKLAIKLCLKSRHFGLAYNYVRKWLITYPGPNAQLWNLFNQIIVRTEDQRHHRFCLRRLEKDPDNLALLVLNGHSWLASGNYKHALSEYVKAHHKMPDDPLYLLMVGIVYTHIASQKYTCHKHSLVVQSFAFLHKYAEARGISQETCYNMGRTLQQLSLDHFAVHFYRRGLASPPLQLSDHAAGEVATFDLRNEIAYNLSLIYRKSNNIELANRTLLENCIV